MRGRSQCRTISVKNTPYNYNVIQDLDGVILIDLDNDEINNDSGLDAPETSRQNAKKSTRFKVTSVFPRGGVITIDVDDIDDVVQSKGIDSDASSSKSCPVSNSAQKSKELDENTDDDEEECRVIGERNATYNFLKCNQKDIPEASSRNRYGLYSESDIGSVESDGSDCELVEDSVGEVREQWEKASRRKMLNANNDFGGSKNQGSTSGLKDNDYIIDAGIENTNDKYSTSIETENEDLGRSFFNFEMEIPLDKWNNKFVKKYSGLKPCSTEKMQDPLHKGSFQFRKETSQGSDERHKNEHYHTPPHCMDEDQNSEADERYEFLPGRMVDSDITKNASMGNSKHGGEGEILDDTQKVGCCEIKGRDRGGFPVKGKDISEESLVSGSQFSDKTRDQHTKGPTAVRVKAGVSEMNNKKFGNKDNSNLFPGEISPAYTQDDEDKTEQQKSVEAEESLTSPVPSMSKQIDVKDQLNFQGVDSAPSTERDITNDRERQLQIQAEEAQRLKNKKKAENRAKASVSGINKKKFGKIDHSNLSPGEISPPYTQDDEDKTEQQKSVEAEAPLGNPVPSISKLTDVQDQLNFQGSDSAPSTERDIINDREKLKETDTYKKAIEEEWASRQRQLQIQAEEVQRLKKRRRAENMRLLDMERRQKQRVEEMRVTQKKDEEKLHMKEQIRAECTKKLTVLETQCPDMASLLRGLGINVDGGPCPLSNQVHAAYKKALLKFHPDRASKDNIRQQVEAEEKFKLISRIKEEFASKS